MTPAPSWNPDAALSYMAAAHRAVEAKGIDPFAAPIRTAAANVVRAWIARDLPYVRVWCYAIEFAAARLPTGSYPWNPR
jgi:hypothetical protein